MSVSSMNFLTNLPAWRGLALRCGRRGLWVCVPVLLVACSSTKSPPAAPAATPKTSAARPAFKAKTQPSGADTAKSVPAPAVGNIRLLRPAEGPVIGRFDGSRNKGLDIAGKAGDPVLAAEAGRVVYAGTGLRGYGNLLVVKHSETLLTSYAHNRKLLVRENEAVRKGQKIAEMGSSDADRVKLHFEVRRDGNAVDPAPYLGVQ